MILNASNAVIHLNLIFRLMIKICSIARIVKSRWLGFTRPLVPYLRERVGGKAIENSS
jgi:hypothetical protein